MGGVAGRALVGLGDDGAGDVVEGPLAGFDDVTESLALNGVGSGHHSDEDRIGAEVGDAGEGGEVGLAGTGAGADEADGLGAGKGGGELHAGEFVHPGKVFRSENHARKVARDGKGARAETHGPFSGVVFLRTWKGKRLRISLGMLQGFGMRWLLASGCLIRFAFADPVLEKFVDDPSLKTASVGVFVIPIEGDVSAMEWQADTGLIPASTLKAITTATALQVLGEEFVFETKLFLKGDDLVVKGDGDPTLGATGLEGDFGSWLKALKTAGVPEIKGDVIADASRFESRTTPDSWSWGDVGNYYGAGPSGLNFHRNSYALTFRPGEVGARAKLVKTWPTPPGVVFENHMRTGSAGSGDQGYVYGGPGATMISMRGTVPTGGDFTIRGALPDPPLFCAVSLKKYLEENGIAVGGVAKVGSVKIEGEPLHVQKSPALKKIITATNHRSVNLYADSLFKALSPEGTTAASVKVLKTHWSAQGIDLTGFDLHDGSGLSPRDTVTARQMAMILKKARSHATGEVFRDSLPVAGRSGTMAGFGNGTGAEGKVWAKSGGLTRVKTYCGYFVGKSGQEYAFAVMTNNAVARPKRALEGLLSGLVKSR